MTRAGWGGFRLGHADMGRLRSIAKAPSAAEAFAALRIGGAVVVGVAVVLGPAGHGGAFYVALAGAFAYAIAIGVTALLGMRKQPSVVTRWSTWPSSSC